MNKDVEFPAGLFAKRKDNAPDFVLCSLSIKKREFIAYLESMGGDDWANFVVMRSKANKIYVKVDTWEPDPNKTHKEGMEQARQAVQEEMPEDDIPF